MKQWEVDSKVLKKTELVTQYKLTYTYKKEQRSFLVSYNKDTFHYHVVDLELMGKELQNPFLKFSNVQLVDIIDYLAKRMQ